MQNSRTFIATSGGTADFYLYVSADVVLIPRALEVFYPHLNKLKNNLLIGSIGFLASDRSEPFFIPLPQHEFYEGVEQFPFVILSRRKLEVPPLEVLKHKSNVLIPEITGYTTASDYKRNSQFHDFKIRNIPGISIVIPTCGQLNERGNTFLSECVKSLVESLEGELYQIIIVFDGDEVPRYLTDSIFDSNLIEFVSFTEPRFNFSKKVNLGVLSSKYDRILLLNDDMKVVTKNWNLISHNIEATTSAGILGSLLIYEDLRIQHFGIRVGRDGYSNFLAGAPLDDPKIAKEVVTRQVSAVTGAWLLTSRKVWSEIHGFDEMLPNNFGDVDFCLRARTAGYKIVQTGEVTFFHFESQSRVTNVLADEFRYFQIRWASSLTIDSFLPSLGQIPVYNRKSREVSILRRALDLYIAQGGKSLILRAIQRIKKMMLRDHEQ
jgi:GT2 family glycosyltransferase